MKVKILSLLISMAVSVFGFDLTFIESPVNEATGRTPISEGSMMLSASGTLGYRAVKKSSDDFWFSVSPSLYKFISDGVAVGGNVSYSFHGFDYIYNYIGLGPGMIYYMDFNNFLPSFLSAGKTFVEARMNLGMTLSSGTSSSSFSLTGTAGTNYFFTPERAFTPYASVKLLDGNYITLTVGLSMDSFVY